jgi:DNA-binding CsgD family transcriptional regulator
MTLLGRRAECARLEALVAALRDGRSDALVLAGETGSGKTALLEYAVDAAAGHVRVLRASGAESERDLPYATLHQLCLPLLDGLDRLPAPQAEALATIFGARTGPAPSPFLVGLGVLNLLAEAARDRPLLCVVDDAHWLDDASAQTVSFVARRLRAESTLMLIATREPVASMHGLAEMTVAGLAPGAARQLLDSVVRWPLDDSVRTAMLAEARGNPLALLELPLTAPDRMAGGFGLLDVSALSGRLEESRRRQIEALPDDSKELLLLAAADSAGDPVLIWRAAAALGLSPQARTAAEDAGLLTIGVRITFSHPLVRSAVYHAAPPEARRRVHRALAEATPQQADPDRRAWHLAHAAEGRDEAIAAELEATADLAQSRGGLAASAAFLERAAALTPDPATRADRELAAARGKYRAGAPGGAHMLLDQVESGPADELRAAHVTLLRAHLAHTSGDADLAPGLGLEAARRFEAIDPDLAREAYLDTIGLAWRAARYAGENTVAAVAKAALAAPPPSGPPKAPDLLLDALAVLYTDGPDAGTPLVRRALARFLDDELPPTVATRWLTVANFGAFETWDDTTWERISELNVRHIRNTGALGGLPTAYSQRMIALLHAGRFQAAADLLEEYDAVVGARWPRPGYDTATVAAWRGDKELAAGLIREGTDLAAERHEGAGVTLLQYANSILYNGLGEFPEAMAAAQLATADPTETGFAPWVVSELVEAAVRCGEREVAVAAVERIVRSTGPSGTAWGRGIEARVRALISEGPEAEALYQEAIDNLRRSRNVVALARVRLLLGEWLHEHGRDAEARTQLSTAHDSFVEIGALAFAERTRRVLVACGAAVPVHRVAMESVELTEQETRIAQLARDGRSNTEIGAELFLSPRTVEWHLRKVFTKLGIASRRDLPSVLP